MQLDLTSFILELINFAVLVWILHRFLYRPVLAAIDRRRSAVEHTLSEAKAAREQAAAARSEVETRLAEWESERAQARSALAAELAAQREKGLADAARAAEQERARLAALQAKQALEQQRANESRALEQAGTFVARLLERLSGPELDARLVELFAADLAGLGTERRTVLAEAARAAEGRVAVHSARPLDDAARARVEQALSEVLGVDCHAEFAVDAALLSGLSVALGPWLLQADLRDELRFFSAGPRDAG
ncbi:MAG: F0F1 ATP synthase subunit delta [Betaproteobacteria bacterium]|jgi:F-type H+-transporting ATPase subunit b|nr:F0F1 ATP synthase subunit delta [Betaproteobacteria bacterium]